MSFATTGEANGRPRARIRRTPEEFRVDELPAYAPSGEGEHLFLHVRKRGWTTLDAVAALARALGADARQAGYAGMKDRHAVTTQWVSLPWPLARALPELSAGAEVAPGLVVLEAKRHGNKLKTGHLRGNRFTIVLGDVPRDAIEDVAGGLAAAGARGVPNAFGPQRFGRDGDNAERALAWLAGRAPGPRHPREQRLLFSALQSHAFNLVLARRVAEGTWDVPLAGDILRKRDSGGLFACVDPEADAPRAAAGEVAPTGPMFGAKMRHPEGVPLAIEEDVLRAIAGRADVFDAHRKLGEGTRRSLRLDVAEMAIDRDGPAGDLRVEFVLPQGGYATTVLGAVVDLDDAAASRAARGDEPLDAPVEPSGDAG